MQNFWQGKRVLITGHTGFKGSWLTLLLHRLGARLYGASLEPEANSLFEHIYHPSLINHHLVDITTLSDLDAVTQVSSPDVIFHLAAQPLVLESYQNPVHTWQTNVMGSINMMEAARRLEKKCALVMVTTDKVYHNNEWDLTYRETDTLGGLDPYSSSKASCELAISSWSNSFFKSPNSSVGVASARAGNVIGGGDFAKNRIFPDLYRSFSSGLELSLRSPFSTRPWQHVLDPLYGYLVLAQSLYTDALPKNVDHTFNFGPDLTSNISVQSLVKLVCEHWPQISSLTVSDTSLASFHEAGRLNLSYAKAFHQLSWQPLFNIADTVRLTCNWYSGFRENQDNALTLCYNDISYLLSRIG